METLPPSKTSDKNSKYKEEFPPLPKSAPPCKVWSNSNRSLPHQKISFASKVSGDAISWQKELEEKCAILLCEATYTELSNVLLPLFKNEMWILQPCGKGKWRVGFHS